MYRTLTDRLQGLLLVVLAVGVLAGAVLADRAFTRHERDELTADVQRELERVISATEAVMRDFLQLSRGVAAAIIADPELDQAAFERIARELFQEYPEVRNVAAAPGLVIRYVYPIEGNESALGLDYRSVPEQYRVVARARDTRQAIVDGPVSLVQGGTGFIMRNPIFLRQGTGEPEFWGLVAGVLDADDLFRRIGLDDPELPVEVAIRRVADGDDAARHIFGDAGMFTPENIEKFVFIQGYTWQFVAAPAAGWSVDPVRRLLFRVMLAVIVIFILLPASALMRAQRRLRGANADLDATLAAIPQTLFEVDRGGGIRAVWADPNGLLAGHGDSVASVLPGDVSAVLMQAVALTHAGSPATTRHVCIRRDDTARWFEMSVAAKAVDDTFLVLMHDRTERWLVEQQERIRHAVLEKLGQGSPVGDMLEFIMRQVPARKSGLQCAVVMDGKVVAAPDMAEPLVAELAALVGAGERQRRIVSALSPGLGGGGVEQVLVEPVLGADAALLASAVFTTTDADTAWPQLHALVEFIAQMVGLTIERARLNESLAIAESVYRGSSEGMMLVDSDERIIAVNPAFTAITGYSESEVIGHDQKLLRSPRYGEDVYREIRLSLARTGSWSGELWGRHKDGHDFASWITVNWVDGGATGGPHTIALFSDISEKKKADELIWAQANYDALTQLPNRRLFVDRLEQGLRKADRDNSLLALLMVDLDDFKEVNDTLGHHFGDQLLVEAARRISSCVRASDSVSRLGGDEFTVMMTDLRTSADVDRVTQKVLDILAEPFHIESHPVYISGSIGITLFPDDAENSVDMMKNADQAMYESKRLGRNRYTWFSHSMQEAAQSRMRLAADLRVAIEQEQFHVVYQPIVRLDTGRVDKVEALVRWEHPERGAISPVTFIPVAEETGMIDAIGHVVFRNALREVAGWRERFDPAFKVGVNNSPVQFQEKYRLHQRCLDELSAAGLHPSAVIMEITEGVLMSSDAYTRAQLHDFQQSGFALAIDDFGTGYSSLSYLKKFAVDYLKIDRSFTAQLAPGSSDLALCEAIVVMAHKLELRVIAEGVETEQQHELLRGIGCDFGQGYYYARPMTAEAMEQFMEEKAGAP